jgi:hypothetical protein
MTVGIETGVGLPVFGLYNQISSSQFLNAWFSRPLGRFSFSLAGGIENYQGRSESYELENYSFLAGLAYQARLIRLSARVGPGYLRRSAEDAEEKGWVLAYDAAVSLPAHFERIEVAPTVGYHGLGDLAGNAGILCLGLRFGYEI